jgi:hypothetical protein
VLSALVLPVLVAACVSGCLTADGTLAPDGSGTFTVSYKAPPGATEASLRPLLMAPGATVESFTLADDRTVTGKVKVADLATINKMPLFKNVTVTRTAEGDDQVLTVKATNPPKSVDDKTLAGPKIEITLPGKVLEASEPGKIDGKRVTWSFTLAEWYARKTVELEARYRPDAKTG